MCAKFLIFELSCCDSDWVQILVMLFPFIYSIQTSKEIRIVSIEIRNQIEEW